MDKIKSKNIPVIISFAVVILLMLWAVIVITFHIFDNQ
jgi:hypothetical protein